MDDGFMVGRNRVKEGRDFGHGALGSTTAQRILLMINFNEIIESISIDLSRMI